MMKYICFLLALATGVQCLQLLSKLPASFGVRKPGAHRLFSTDPQAVAAVAVGSSASSSSITPNTGNNRPSNEKSNRPQKDSFLVLDKPQLLIRFRAPRVKSELKIQLESLQESYRIQTESARPTPSYSPSQGSAPRFGFLESAAPVFNNEDKKPASSKGKFAYSKDKDRQSERPKTTTDWKGKKGRNEDDEEDESAGGGDSDSAGGEQYYGDEEEFDLSSVPIESIRNMENEGYTLEDIQLSLYGEYGIKASVNAIRNKIRDEARERKSKGKTGKTRRDKIKAKIARKNGPITNDVQLPEGPIQVSALAELLDISASDIVRYLMMNVGVLTTMNQSVENKLARDIVVSFGGVLVGDSADEAEDEEAEAAAVDDSGGSDSDGDPRPPVVTIMGHVGASLLTIAWLAIYCHCLLA